MCVCVWGGGGGEDILSSGYDINVLASNGLRTDIDRMQPPGSQFKQTLWDSLQN